MTSRRTAPHRIAWSRSVLTALSVLALGLGACASEAPPSPLDTLTGEDAGRTGVWIELGEMQVSEEAVLPEAMESFRGVAVERDRLVFDFGGEAPLEIGDVVAGGGMDAGYMRVVTATETLADGRQAVTTRQAGLDELFDTYELTVRGRPRELPEGASSETLGVAEAALTERFNWRECVGGRFPFTSTGTLPGGRCGDGRCDGSESLATCAADCGPDAMACGNGVCDAGETETSCLADCDDGIPSWAEATLPPGTAPTACGGVPESTNTCTIDGEVVAEVCPYLDWEPNFDWGIRPIEAYLNVDTSLTAGVTATAGARVHAHCSADFVRMLGLPERLNLASLDQTWVIGCIPAGTSCIPVYFGIEALVFAEPVLQGEMDFRFDTGEVVANAQMRAAIQAGGSVGLGGIEHHFDPSVTPSASFENTRAGGIRIETGVRAGVVLRLAIGVRVSVGTPPLPTIPAALLERVGVPIPDSLSIGAGAYVQVEIIGHLNSIFENDFSGCGWHAEVPYCLEGNIAAGAYVTTPIPGVGVSVDGRWNLFNVEGTAYSNGEAFEECRMRSSCADGAPTCDDMVFGSLVCEGEPGYVACGMGAMGEVMAQRCTCGAAGFEACGPCAMVGAP